MELSLKEIERIFRDDGYRLAETILRPSFTRLSLLTLMKTAYEAVDSLIHSFSNRIRNENKTIDCKKGCHWCCSQSVFIAPWEGFYLQDLIYKRFTTERISIIKTRSIEKHHETRDLSLQNMLLKKITCPLLEGNICSVYPNRPMACRIYLSMNVDSCIREFKDPGNMNYFAELYDFPFRAGRGINEGIARWMEESNMDTTNLSLESALVYLLEDTNAAENWRLGKDRFERKTWTEQELIKLSLFQKGSSEEA